MMHLNCPTFSGNPNMRPLVFDWDEDAGEVSGPDADYIRECASSGGIEIHPLPSYHTFSSEPLKSRVDMAAIIGVWHRVPDDLRQWYPQIPPSTPTGLQLLY